MMLKRLVVNGKRHEEAGKACQKGGKKEQGCGSPG